MKYNVKDTYYSNRLVVSPWYEIIVVQDNGSKRCKKADKNNWQ